MKWNLGDVAAPKLKHFEDGDFRKIIPRFSKENFPKNLELVDKIVQLADKNGIKPSQLTLSWLLSEGDDIFPIPGTTKIERLQENVNSMFVELSPEDISDFREALDKANVHGLRYPNLADTMFADSPPMRDHV
jgi:aryl-alcohol dehydrogenase-like predicted oxidoreductase